MNDRWVVEARLPDGSLDLKGPQPEDFFGNGAITGLTEDQLAKVVWQHAPDAVLTGFNIPRWPAAIDGRFTARRKTW